MIRNPRNLLIMALVGFVFGLIAAFGFVQGRKLTAPSQDVAKAEIAQTLTNQAAQWNKGDIAGFMASYWNSPELRFTSGGTVRRGFAETKAGYERRYPTQAIMGTLQFSELDIDVLNHKHALVHGRFTLLRESDTPTGLFTLHLQKTDGLWIIKSDHTSVD